MARRRATKRTQGATERLPGKPRRSRWARWVLRPLVWSPALLALLVGALLVVLESDRFALWVKRFAEEQAGSYLGRQVKIGSLAIDLVPLSVEATDLVIAAEDPEDLKPAGVLAEDSQAAPAFLEAARVQVAARVGSLLRPSLTLERIFVDRPVIRIAFDESGRHDAPRPRRRRPEGAPRRVEVAVGAVEVVRGLLEFEHRRYPLDVSARNFVANLGGVESAYSVELAGQARAEDVSVVLPGARPYLGTVSVRGSYRPGSLDVAAARFEAPDLTAQVDGALRWREEPGAEFSIAASGQGRLLDRLGYGEGLVEGPFDFDGDFTRTPDDWLLEGDLSSSGVAVVERRLSDVGGRLLVDGDGARYRIETARYGDGSVTGSVRMALGSGDAPVELDLRADRVDVGRLLQDQKIPIAGLAAVASGAFTYQFARSEPRAGNGWADLRIAPRLASHATGLPVAGSAVFSFGDGTLRTEAVRVRNQDHLIVANGSYDMVANRGSFDVEVTTKAVEEILALLPLEDAPAIWQPDRGRGEVSAAIVLEGESVSVGTEIDLEGVVAPGFAADRLQGRFVLDAVGLEDLRLELLRPAAALIVAGSVPLVPEAGALGRGFGLAIDAEGWPLADLAPWLPFEMPLQGLFSGGATLEGSLESPEGSVQGRVAAPSLGSLTAPFLDLELDFSPDEVLFREARLEFAQGEIRARGAYELLEDRLDLSIDSDGLSLAAFGLSDPPERLGGALVCEGSLRGGLERPEVSMLVSLRGATLDGQPLGDTGAGELRFDWDGAELEAEGAIEGLVEIAGGGALGFDQANLAFEVSSPDLRTMLALAATEPLPEFEANGVGRVEITSAIGADALPSARLRLDELTVQQVGFGVSAALRNLEPVTLILDNNAIEVESLYVGTSDGASEFFVAGRIDLASSRSLDLRLQSSLSTSWFEPWMPAGVELSQGTFDVIGSISGTASEPRLDGVGRLTGGKVVTTGFPATFDSTEAVFLFFPGQVVLDQLTARVAGGRITAAGRVNLKEAEEPDYRFQVSGEGLSFRYPEGWSIRGKTDFTVASVPGGRQVTGALDLDRALYVTDVPIELDQLLRSYFEQRRLEVEETDELLATTQLNLAVTAKETLRIRNNLANLRGSADLVLRGSLASPVVFGTVEFDPSGRLVYSGNEYELERGVLTFANPYKLEPVIDLVARTGLREYDVTLSLSGTPERLSFDFLSDPPLAELEVMALMTGGRPQGPNFGRTARTQDLESGNVGAESFLYGQATSLVANRFNRLFGLDQFRIVPLTSATGDLSSARVTVGKQLSRDLLATYSYDPSETGEQILEIEWSVSRSLVLVVTQNGDGTYAVDAKYQKAF